MLMIQLLQAIIKANWIFPGGAHGSLRPDGATKRVVIFTMISKRWQKSWQIASGKHTKSYGKSQFLMGKLTINGHFQ